MVRELHVCKRCGYAWISNILPVRCAKCKTPYWNKERKKKGSNDEATTPDPLEVPI